QGRWARDLRGQVAGPRGAVERHPWTGSEYRYGAHPHGVAPSRNGGRVAAAADAGREIPRPERGREPVEQGEEPRSSFPAEGEGVHPPCGVGSGYARAEETR